MELEIYSSKENVTLTLNGKTVSSGKQTLLKLFPWLHYKINHNYNKILKSDWLSTALISALIGQFDRTVRVMPK